MKVAAVLGALSATGCGSAGSFLFADLIGEAPRPFSGVRLDWDLVRGQPDPLWTMLCMLDLPLSLGVDVLLLPLTLAAGR